MDRSAYILVGLQILFVAMLALVSAHPVPFVFDRPMLAAMSFWAVGLALVLARTGLHALRSQHPVPDFLAGLRSEVPVMVRALKIALLAGAALALHGWAKSMMPLIVDFWADPPLADLDAFIFGRDPWPLFRAGWLMPVYGYLYLLWFPITFMTLGFVAFSRRDHRGVVTAFLATLVLGGTIGQYLLPSAGPIFFERIGLGPRFAELVATNHFSFNRVSDYLWLHYSARDAAIGTGISAMPSVHVALAVWTACAAWRLWRPLALPMALYALGIWAASIASGWHYFTDGLAGGIIALACFHVAARRPSGNARLRAGPGSSPEFSPSR
ncbi:MAG TPA: phosphatase PAP2 family protein [Sphingomicrobium sp.]